MKFNQLLFNLESDNESIITGKSLNRFSFDIRSVLDDDRRRLLKKYRETKKKVKLAFRRQADQGRISFFEIIIYLIFFSYIEILNLLNTFTSSNESKLTLINELIYECQRIYPAFESRLIQYKMNIVTDLSLKEDEPSSSSLTIQDVYM
jgi:hypothetical protein